MGRVAAFNWTLGGSTAFRFTANPYNKVVPRNLHPIRTLFRPNAYTFQLDYAPDGGTWDIEISVTGNPDAVFTLWVGEQQEYTLGQGKSSYQKLVGVIIGVSATYLKGDVEIGYTLDQTG